MIICVCCALASNAVQAQTSHSTHTALNKPLTVASACTQPLAQCPLTFPSTANSQQSMDPFGSPETNNLLTPEHTQHPSVLPELGDGSEGTLTPWEEQNWGRRIMQIIRRDPDYLADTRVRDYFSTVAQRLAAAAVRIARRGSNGQTHYIENDHSSLYTASGTQLQRSEASELSKKFAHIAPDFEVFAVRDPQINAFSLPGGFIGLNTGLVSNTQTESELASVLAHEMGHVLQRHSARKGAANTRSSYAALAGMLLGVIAGVATGSADLGGALAMSGQAYGVDSQLKFSRAAEREADRIGFLLLEEAGYDPYGMPAFFERLELGAPSETSLPAYMRTHPLTRERIADMMQRAQRTRYRQPRQDPEYSFVRAQLKVLEARSDHEYARIERTFSNALNSQTAPNPAANFYGMALAHLLANQPDSARADLEKAQQAFRSGPCLTSKRTGPCTVNNVRYARSLDILQIELMGLGPKPAHTQAIALAKVVVKRWPYSRAAQEAQIKAQLAAKHYREVQTLARTQAQLEPNQTLWWNYLALASAALGDTVNQHRALAEKYALEGAWPSAILQLQTARQTPKLPLYERAEIESRINEMKNLYKKAKEEEKSGPPA